MENKSLGMIMKIESELENILNDIEMSGGEVTDEQLAFIQLAETNKADLPIKAGNYVIAIKIIESNIESMKVFKAKLEHEIKMKQNNIDRMKDALLDAVKLFGDIETNNFHKITIRKSETTEISDENLIPNEFKTYVPKIDKTAIKQAIKSGVDVAGAFIKTNDNLSIK